MAVYYVDADELDGIASATSNARNDLWWALKPIDTIAWGAPWPWDTRSQWERARHIVNFELGWLDNDARALRARAGRARAEAFYQTVMELAPKWTLTFPLVPFATTVGVLALAAWAALTSKSKESARNPTKVIVDPLKPQTNTNTAHPVRPVGAVLSNRFDRVNSFKSAFLGVKGVTWQPGPNGAIEGRHDSELDGECVSLVKRYIRWVDSDVRIPSISPGSPGNAYGPNWTKLTPSDGEPFSIRAGDIVYLNYGHVAIAATDQDATGRFEMIESNGWVRDPSQPKGGYVPADSKDSVVQMAPGGQNKSRVTTIMRRG